MLCVAVVVAGYYLLCDAVGVSVLLVVVGLNLLLGGADVLLLLRVVVRLLLFVVGWLAVVNVGSWLSWLVLLLMLLIAVAVVVCCCSCNLSVDVEVYWALLKADAAVVGCLLLVVFPLLALLVSCCVWCC